MRYSNNGRCLLVSHCATCHPQITETAVKVSLGQDGMRHYAVQQHFLNHQPIKLLAATADADNKFHPDYYPGVVCKCQTVRRRSIMHCVPEARSKRRCSVITSIHGQRLLHLHLSSPTLQANTAPFTPVLTNITSKHGQTQLPLHLFSPTLQANIGKHIYISPVLTNITSKHSYICTCPD